MTEAATTPVVAAKTAPFHQAVAVTGKGGYARPRFPSATMSRILHIEDDAANRLLVRKLLSSAGHEVIDAGDGIEGVRLACAIKPDLVLVDLNIPGLNGFEVTLRLRVVLNGSGHHLSPSHLRQFGRAGL